MNLPKNSFINLKLIEELDLLFGLVSSHVLRRSITEIFFSHLCNTEPKNYKEDLKEISTDFYCLLKFLEAAETCEREHELEKMKNKN